MAILDDTPLVYLLAESGIRQLYGRYADALWRQDVTAFTECFTEDAVWKIVGQTLSGRTELGSFFEMVLRTAERVMMWVGPTVLDVVGDTATGRTQITELIKRKDGSSARTLAVYYDRFAASDGLWRFQLHHFNLYYMGPPDLSSPYFECPEYGPPPAMPRPDDPTSAPNG
jgi:uncharacterized protein (TIGR02246 family)